MGIGHDADVWGLGDGRIEKRDAVAMMPGSSGGPSGSGSGSPEAPATGKMPPMARLEHTRKLADDGWTERKWMFMTYPELEQDSEAPKQAQFQLEDRSSFYADVLNGLTGVQYGRNAKTPKSKNQKAIALTHENMKRISWAQRGNYYKPAKQTPTNAFYTNIYCTASHLIIVQHAVSPGCSLLVGAEDPETSLEDYQLRDKNLLPDLQHWSDLTFLEFAHLRVKAPVSMGKALAPPSWILVRAFDEPPYSASGAMRAISYCVATYSGPDKYSAWPVITFPVGTYCFNAIMGINIGKAIGRLLITHMERFAAKRDSESGYAVDSITVFLMPGDDKDEYQHPSLLFHISKVDSHRWGDIELEAMYKNNAEAGLEAPGSGIGETPPHPVTPVKEGKTTPTRKKGKGRSKKRPASGNSPGNEPGVGSSKKVQNA